MEDGKVDKVIIALEALHNAMHKNQCYTCSYEFVEVAEEFGTEIITDAIETLKELAKWIEKQTTVKNGHWIEEQPNTYTRRTKCSECDASAPFICVSDDYYGSRNHGETRKTKYCPNCGARME